MKKLISCIVFISIILFVFMPIAIAAEYYVDATNGNDSNLGTSSSSPWRTLKKVSESSFKPGDFIYLKRGQIWEESLKIPSSGEAGKPITFGAYGSGNNPLIKLTVPYSNWELIVEEGKKIWKGTGILKSYGAMKNSVRLPMYLGYEYSGDSPEKIKWSKPSNITEMLNGLFYAPEDDSRVFYLRWDEGNPGVVEIGEEKYGFYIIEKQHITIDSIDIYGPGGKGWSSSRQIYIISSHYITIKNCTLRYHNNGGVIAKDGSSNCTFENVTSHGHRATGIYLWEAGQGNRIIGCKVFNCGNVFTDYGDGGLIGVWQTSGARVESCHVYGNGGKHFTNIDAAISFAQSPNGVVMQCMVENVGGTGVQFAEMSDNGFIAYSIVNGWGLYNAGNMNEGIRIGGGAGPTAINCKVYNNMLINNSILTSGNWAALRMVNQNNSGLEIKNNIFYNNVGIYEIYAESNVNFKGWKISNNIFYRTSGNAINWAGKIYDYAHIVGQDSGFFSADVTQEEDSLTGDPKLNLEKRGLNVNSPLIDKGVSLGLTKDFHGNLVFKGNGVDIGPFEYQGSAPILPPEGLKVISK